MNVFAHKTRFFREVFPYSILTHRSSTTPCQVLSQPTNQNQQEISQIQIKQIVTSQLQSQHSSPPALTKVEVKNAIQGNLRSWVSTNTFCTNTLGLQLWFRQRPILPIDLASIMQTSSPRPYCLRVETNLTKKCSFNRVQLEMFLLTFEQVVRTFEIWGQQYQLQQRNLLGEFYADQGHGHPHPVFVLNLLMCLFYF